MKKNAILLPVLLAVLFYASTESLAAQSISNEERFPAPLIINQEKVINNQVTLYIPFVSGMKDPVIQGRINDILRKDIDMAAKEWNKSYGETYETAPPENRDGIHFWQTYAVKYNKANVLSITELEYNFTGGAHGNAFLRAYTINTETGKVYSLPELFDAKKDWKQAIDSFIKKENKVRSADYDFKGINDKQAFYVTEEGLVIYFQPYEIGTWADGIVRFVLPYSYIAEYFSNDLMLY